ncbi:HAD family hydrolase [Yoonia sediminilitoris]|uniref:phosphoglycolate phosphatase n=1 Tax=Yoonia sediminilitoris TaxID=1286148 RepID=A0A2T6KB69_9RHOB|nr:HAD family hydrolase [Yoonia sediminilitoris]PUB12098.1 phosphoglycolate phosphatase [Yoonia sediminilitoris]RCW92925.1 phosphoglycolate phosphatase [Yoonia sediminilitoris]
MIKGIIFDKDGTLFDFNATWGAWTRAMITSELGHDPAQMDRLAAALGFRLTDSRFEADSPVIASTADEIAQIMLPLVPDTNHLGLLGRMNATAANVPQIEATPLVPFFAQLRALGLKLGVATNDAEAPARAHLGRAGVTAHLDFIAGYDSGYGGKPAPGQLMGFCEVTGLAPANCVMVGDSLHDLHAGQAAGMRTVGVLTGPATREELANHADVVLDSIAELPAWIAQC